MKKIVAILLLASSFQIVRAKIADTKQDTYTGSTVKKVWETITENPYKSLPQEKVNMQRLTRWGRNKLEQDTKRTLSDRSDLLPRFEKLVHPNGICLQGTWNIDRMNPYSGLFKFQTTAQVISRASVALSDTKKGKYRAFGLATKLYPTSFFLDKRKHKTANFFVVDDLGGTKAPRYMGVKMTNEPKVSFRPSAIFSLNTLLFVARKIGAADKNAGIRQLWQLSEIDESPEDIATPKWIRIGGIPGEDISDAADFRSELLEVLEDRGEISFDIEVAGRAGTDDKKEFKRIGTMTYTKAIASENCDHRLHFNHPKFREDIR